MKYQMKILQKVVVCIRIRLSTIRGNDSDLEIPLEEIKRLNPVLRNFINMQPHDFPDDINQRIKKQPLPDLLASELDSSLQERDTNSKRLSQKYSTLLPKLTPEPGKHYISVRIIKMGLKDAPYLTDPFVQITCKDNIGVDLCSAQSTPTPSHQDDLYLYFNVDVELQLPLEHFPTGSAVFFQLFYYKEKRRVTKAKCFSFMDIDELKTGQCVVEIYKKSGNIPKRKKLELLTSRPLFLHLALNVTKVS